MKKSLKIQKLVHIAIDINSLLKRTILLVPRTILELRILRTQHSPNHHSIGQIVIPTSFSKFLREPLRHHFAIFNKTLRPRVEIVIMVDMLSQKNGNHGEHSRRYEEKGRDESIVQSESDQRTAVLVVKHVKVESEQAGIHDEQLPSSASVFAVEQMLHTQTDVRERQETRREVRNHRKRQKEHEHGDQQEQHKRLLNSVSPAHRMVDRQASN